MSAARVGIIGAGAAGTSAARLLHTQAPEIEVELFARTGEKPANRTLVTKGALRTSGGGHGVSPPAARSMRRR